MIEANVIVGILIILINLIPMILRKWSVLYFTITLSVVLALIFRFVQG